MKSLNLISDKSFNAICWSSSLLGIFMTKKGVECIVITLGLLRKEFDIKTSEMLGFLPFMNNSAIVPFDFY